MNAIETIEHWLNCSRSHDGSVADTAAAVVRGLEDSGFAIVAKVASEKRCALCGSTRAEMPGCQLDCCPN